MNLSRVLSPSCLERGLTPVLHWGFFCVSVDPVAVVGNEEDLLMHLALRGLPPGAAVSPFFSPALLALAVGLDGPPGREHRPGYATPCEPRSVPERLQKH